LSAIFDVSTITIRTFPLATENVFPMSIVGALGIENAVPCTTGDGFELPAEFCARNVTLYVVTPNTPVVIVKGLVVVFIKK
jgi:hypothetical protein